MTSDGTGQRTKQFRSGSGSGRLAKRGYRLRRPSRRSAVGGNDTAVLGISGVSARASGEANGDLGYLYPGYSRLPLSSLDPNACLSYEGGGRGSCDLVMHA